MKWKTAFTKEMNESKKIMTESNKKLTGMIDFNLN
jgi:hypothetical protein